MKTTASFGQFWILPMAFSLAWGSVQAQPTIVSTSPPNMATGVSGSAPVVFTFSEAMNTGLTTVLFMDTTTYTFPATTAAWSAGNTVLTCTPVVPFADGHMIVWSVDGESAGGVALGGTPAGMFTPGGGDSGCSSTNGPLESFTVAKGALYQQNSAAAPALNPDCPYNFTTCLWLVCPHTATNVMLAPPVGSAVTIPFTSIPGHPLLTVCGYANQADLDTAYPDGPYTFTMKSVSSNQQVSVSFPASLAQPPAPHLTNYAAAQAVDASQPFRLGWEPFAGGTAADCIYVEILPNGFQTPAVGEVNALNGTATSVVIPANTLQPGTQYSSSITFYEYVFVTNATRITMTYRAAITEFPLQTMTGSTPRLVITNAVCLPGGNFSFEVICAPSQFLVVDRRTDLSAQWQPFFFTNTATSRFRVVDTSAPSTTAAFFRVRPGP